MTRRLLSMAVLPDTRRALRVAAAFACATLVLASPCVSAAVVDGVALDEHVKSGGGPELVLNGAGVRVVLVARVYVAALYLPARSSEGEAILHARQPWRLSMVLLRNLTVARLKSSITGALRETLTPEQEKPLAPGLEQMDAIFESLPPLKKGASFVIDYSPQTGTSVQMDGESKGVIAGDDFSEALLRIWIGEHPRDMRLRAALLGAPQ
jgi:hypothetical protein